jgi:TRAP-type C4-dicarboxylate transport system substrate-binding protein
MQELETALPDFQVFDLPYLFTSFATRNKVLDDPSIMNHYDDEVHTQGLTLLGWFGGEERNVFGNGPAIHSVSDMQGQKLRTLPSKTFSAFFSALGADPVSLEATDVFLALSQHTIDMAETGFPSAFATKLNEVSKNFALTKHVFTVTMFAVNTAWFNGLPEAVQKEIKVAAADATRVERQAEVTQQAATEKAIVAAGKVLTRPPLAPFRAIAYKLWAKLIAQSPSAFNPHEINAILARQGVQPPASLQSALAGK